MKLSSHSINWAKNHIQNYYDSDFYVKPFEFQGLWSNWEEVKEYLTGTDINKFTVKNPITYPAPKIKNGFRIVHQLDPIDALVYSALAYEISDYVEKNRVNKNDTVCSYRINTDGNGNFFSDGNGFKNFKSKSMELAGKYNYVLIADITDFYNQTYHHRIQNAIESCDPSLGEISKEIERFLMKLTNKTSRGVPVGPAASIIMTEALLIDVDQYILSKTNSYTRYVDDIRIFADSLLELKMILHDLTQYLYDNHRLTLSSLKTTIIDTDSFINNFFENHEELEKQAIHNSLEELNITIGEYPFIEPIDITEVNDSDKTKAQSEAFVRLMEEILKFDNLDLGLARHILRRAKKLRTRSILPILLENFDFFAPDIRDVVLYLETITNKRMIEHNISKFNAIINHSKSLNIPYVKYWMDYYFTSRGFFEEYEETRTYLNEISNLRYKALRVKRNGNISWLREHKSKIDQYNPWDRRAIIYSGDVLSRGERIPWMEHIISNGDLVDRSLAKYIKGK